MIIAIYVSRAVWNGRMNCLPCAAAIEVKEMDIAQHTVLLFCNNESLSHPPSAMESAPHSLHPAELLALH